MNSGVPKIIKTLLDKARVQSTEVIEMHGIWLAFVSLFALIGAIPIISSSSSSITWPSSSSSSSSSSAGSSSSSSSSSSAFSSSSSSITFVTAPSAIAYPLTLPPNVAGNITRMPASVKMTAQKIAGESLGVYDAQQQIQEWPGEWWEADLTLPVMTRDQAEPWIAFDESLRGKVGTFLLGPEEPNRGQNGNAAPALATVGGTQAAGSKTLATANWAPYVIPNLLALSVVNGSLIAVFQDPVGNTVVPGMMLGFQNVTGYFDTEVGINGQAYPVTSVAGCVVRMAAPLNYGNTAQTAAPGNAVLPVLRAGDFLQLGLAGGTLQIPDTQIEFENFGITPQGTEYGPMLVLEAATDLTLIQYDGTVIDLGTHLVELVGLNGSTTPGGLALNTWYWVLYNPLASGLYNAITVVDSLEAAISAVLSGSSCLGVVQTETGLPGGPGVAWYGPRTANLGMWPPARLYKALRDVIPDASGLASIDIFPCLRENAYDGDPVTVFSPVGTFRKAENAAAWTLRPDLTYEFSLKVREAIP